MISLRSVLFPSAILFAASVAVVGCKKDEPPKPEPAASASGKSKLNLRNPVNQMPKVDPQTMKEYKVDSCFFGTQTLRQARDAYLASLGSAEPSEKKIPNFGVAAPTASPAGSASAKPAANAPPPKPGASGSAKGPEPRKPFEMGVRAPHERNARNCTSAAGLKEPSMPDVDAALQGYAPFAVELAKNIAAAQNYYQKEEYKKDSFAKGKELHKKLTGDFGKLDEHLDKLGGAIAAWRTGHPADNSKWEEGQKTAMAAYEDARNLMLGVVQKKVEAEPYKANVEKVEKSVDALKTFASAHTTDPWGKLMNAPFDAFRKAVKEAKVSDKGLETESFLPIVTSYSGVIEAKHRALMQSLRAKPAEPKPEGDKPEEKKEEKKE